MYEREDAYDLSPGADYESDIEAPLVVRRDSGSASTTEVEMDTPLPTSPTSAVSQIPP